ncbi:MAG TPA: prepilin-type N-terminal cleavage/methylation domain-containing protein [Burkholderiaceae bacterium]
MPRGFSLIELMVTVALIAILLVVAIPAYGTWTADAHVRAAAESLTNAIRLTQATAVAKGRTSLFALTTDAQPSVNSAPAAYAPNWFATLNVLGGSDETKASLGLILKSTEGTQHRVTISGPALVCFNALGRQTSLAAAANSLSTACTAGDPAVFQVSRDAGASRYFKVLVYAGGRVRMCDAAKAISSADPDGC